MVCSLFLCSMSSLVPGGFASCGHRFLSCSFLAWVVPFSLICAPPFFRRFSFVRFLLSPASARPSAGGFILERHGAPCFRCGRGFLPLRPWFSLTFWISLSFHGRYHLALCGLYEDVAGAPWAGGGCRCSPGPLSESDSEGPAFFSVTTVCAARLFPRVL